MAIATLSRPVLTAKYARPAARPAAAAQNSRIVPWKRAMKTPAAARERQEARPMHCVGARMAPLLRGDQLDRGRKRLEMVAGLGNSNQPRLAVDRHRQRLGGRIKDAVSALELRPVNSKVCLVDELV